MKNIEKIQEEKIITRLSEIEGLLRDEKEPFIIENIDEENLDRIKQIAQSYYPNLSLLPIKDNSQKLLIRAITTEKVYQLDIIEIKDKFHFYYREKDYIKCIEYGKELLKLRQLRPITIGIMGLSYLKIGDKENAYKYLKLITLLDDRATKNDYKNLLKALENYDEIREKLSEIYNYLLTKENFYLSEKMSTTKMKGLKSISRIFYPQLDILSFNSGKEKKLIIKITSKNTSDFDIRKVKNDLNSAYRNNDYDKCIELGQELLKLRTIKPVTLGILGNCYLKKGERKKAINYFEAATEISKKYNNGETDFSEFIKTLNSKGKKQYNKEKDKDDRKPTFTVKLDFYDNEMNNYYGIENINKIKEIIDQSKSDVETVCKKLNLKDEETDTIKLIFAREYYYQSQFKKGDEFLKSYQTSKHKTELNRELYEKIKSTRRFYSKRTNENPLKLDLTIKPRSLKKK